MLRLHFALTMLSAAAAPVSAGIIVEPAPPVPSGSPPGIAVRGLAPGQVIRVHAFASFGRWIDVGGGQYNEVFENYHSWADVAADRNGRVAMDQARVRRGTYGLLWSMRRPDDPILIGVFPTGEAAPRPARGTTTLLITSADRVIGSGKVVYGEPSGLRVTAVALGRLNGVFSVRSGTRKRPAIILLHGSEGAGRTKRERLRCAMPARDMPRLRSTILPGISNN